MHRGPPGEALPASHDDVDISGVELDTVADAAGHFGRDQAHSTGFWVPCPQLCSRCGLPKGLLLAISQTVVCVRSPVQ